MGVIQSADYIIVNDVSSATIGLYIDTPPVPPMASQRVTTWSTGIDMDGYSPDNVFDNITLSVKAYSFFPENFDFAAVYAFLADAKKLSFSRFPQKFLRVVQVGSIQPRQKHDGAKIEIDITFFCEPFKYHTQNEEIDVTESHTITNLGTRFSRPVYIIKYAGQGRTYLSVNGEVCSFDPPDNTAGTMYIDCEKMIAYNVQNGVNVNQTPCTDGKFPFLASGVNLLSAYNDAQQPTELSVIGNWRDY